jgi:hypothetical protein
VDLNHRRGIGQAAQLPRLMKAEAGYSRQAWPRFMEGGSVTFALALLRRFGVPAAVASSSPS